MKIENVIFGNLVDNEEYARKVIPFLKPEYFIDNIDKIVYNIIDEYVKKYNTFPTKEAIAIDLSSKDGLSEDQFTGARDVIANLTKNEDRDIDWLLDNTEKFCKDKAIYNALMQSIKIVDDKKDSISVGAIPQILSDALGVSFDTSIGHDFIDDSSSRYEFYHRKETKIPFDIDYLNKVTGGGLSKKTLNIVLAGTGVGKSLFMCHCAAANLMSGYNVLYITLEMAEEKIAERIDTNLMNITTDQLREISKDAYDKKMARISSNASGKLIVKEYPTACAGSANFRHLISELKLKKNFVPDIIYIDYLNICSSSRIKAGSNVNSYTLIKSIAEELRGLAVECNVPIVSATQTNRSGFCLDPYTGVISQEGDKHLKDVVVGDKLLSVNGWNTVKTVFPAQNKKTYCITTKSGKEIYCSAEHKFPVGGGTGENSIKDGLKVGDKLLIK